MLRCSVLVCVAFVVAFLPARAQQPQRLKTEKAEILVETVARGLDHPWGLTFLPDGRMLVTERPGRLRIVSIDGQVSAPAWRRPARLCAGPGRPLGCRA